MFNRLTLKTDPIAILQNTLEVMVNEVFILGKITIGCRIEEAELKEIDLTCQQLGQSRSEWLYGLIREALGKAPALTAKSLATRVKALEDKLARLAR